MQATVGHIIDALNPAPWSAAGGATVTFFSALLLLSAAVLLASEARLLWRGLRLGRLVSRLSKTDRPFKHHDEVADVSATIREVVPELAGETHRLFETSYERFGTVYAGQPARDVFSAERLRRRIRGALLSDQLVRSAPGALIAIGLLGTTFSVMVALSAEHQQGVLVDALRTSLRLTVWGLGLAVFVGAASAKASGLLDRAVDRLTSFIDLQLARGSDQSLLTQLLLVQEQARDTANQSQDSLVELTRIFRENMDADPFGRKETLDALGTRMEDAFSFALQNTMGDTLAHIIERTDQSTQEARALMQGTAKTQVEGVERLVQQVVDGIDQAVGANLRAASQQMVDVARSQAQTLVSWRDNVGGVSELVGQLHKLTDSLLRAASDLGEATAPVVGASGELQGAANALHRILPAMVSAATNYRDSSTVMEHAARTMREGTTSYLDAITAVRSMVEELGTTHEQAMQRFAAGVDQALQGTIREAGRQLEGLSAAQVGHLQAWDQALGTLRPLLADLQRTTAAMDGLAGRFTEAAAPTAAAGKAFEQAARLATTLFPRIEQTARGYDELNSSLGAAAGQLDRASRAYDQAGGRIGELVDKAHTSLELHHRGNKEFTATLAQATQFVEELPRSGQAMNQAARELHSAANETAQLVEHIRGSVSVQDRAVARMTESAAALVQSLQDQASRWETMRTQMDQLQATLGLGVDAFSEKLPASVDQTLRRFNQALRQVSEQVPQTVEQTMARFDQASRTIAERVPVVVDESIARFDHATRAISERVPVTVDESLARFDQASRTITQQVPRTVDDTLIHFDAALAEGVERLGSAVERLREAMDDLQERMETMLDGKR